MKRYDLAAYLVNLHTLLNAQEAAALEKSKALTQEYRRVWDEFKAELEKGN